MSTRIRRILLPLLAGALCLLLGGCATAPSGSFATPEEAVQAVEGLIGTHDTVRVEQIFGPGSMDMFESGDPQADRENFARVGELIREKVGFEDLDANTKIALFGSKEWPWPIPLVKNEGRWRFDTASGREELLNRRIGTNELWTLSSLHEFVEAQREYASEPRDGNPPAYAQRFRSSEGRHDGLYWTAADGEPESPLGDLLADSDASVKEGEPNPYHGYFYRILSAQGSNAPGGVRSYIDAHGRMTGGFAAVAWPAKYGNSGVMSFLISHRGIKYQKDLGADTSTLAGAIRTFDPDASWEPTGDSVESDESDEQPAEAATQSPHAP